MWEWREQYGGQIIGQLKRFGASCDCDDERFTLDARYADAVVRVFVALYEKGYIYRDRYMVNWDPGSRSAISDLEVDQRDVTDTLYYIDYPLASGDGTVTVATVRPETMLADTAVAVNPDDERYRQLVGQTAILPLVGRELPIIADEYVKTDFGTGALKITPGHDPNDFEIGRRHGLEQISVIGEDGLITDEAPERFRGMPAVDAQRAVARRAARRGRDLATRSPTSTRSRSRSAPASGSSRSSRCSGSCGWTSSPRPRSRLSARAGCAFHPPSNTRVYMDWMENIRPWVISRQLWWGHRLPVWYRGGETYVGVAAPDGDGWERDPDVLDTWFSSALWPFATLGWPDRDARATRVLPDRRARHGAGHHLPLGSPDDHDGARVHGRYSVFRRPHPRDHPGARRPSDVEVARNGDRSARPDRGGPRPPVFAEGGSFPAYGADALRWGLLAMASSQDVRFSEERIAQGSS